MLDYFALRKACGCGKRVMFWSRFAMASHECSTIVPPPRLGHRPASFWSFDNVLMQSPSGCNKVAVGRCWSELAEREGKKEGESGRAKREEGKGKWVVLGAHVTIPQLGLPTFKNLKIHPNLLNSSLLAPYLSIFNLAPKFEIQTFKKIPLLPI